MDTFIAELNRLDERLSLKFGLPEVLKLDEEGLKKTLHLIRPHCIEQKGYKCLKQMNSIYKRYLINGHNEALFRGDRVNTSKCFNLLAAFAEDSWALHESGHKKNESEVQPPTIHSQEDSSQSDLSKITRPPLGKRNATVKNPTLRDFAVPEMSQSKDKRKMVSSKPSTSNGMRNVKSRLCSNTSDSDSDSSRDSRFVSKRVRRGVAESSSSEESNESISLVHKLNSCQRKKSSYRSKSKRLLYSDSEISSCSKPKVMRSKSANNKRGRIQRSISECSFSSFSSSQSEDTSRSKNKERVKHHCVDSGNKNRHKKQPLEKKRPISKSEKVNLTNERSNSRKGDIGPVPEFVKKLKQLEESVLKGTLDPLEKCSAQHNDISNNKVSNKNESGSKKSHYPSSNAPSATKATRASNNKSQAPAKKSRAPAKKLTAPTKKISASTKKSSAPTKKLPAPTKKIAASTKESSAPTKNSPPTKKSPPPTMKSSASTKQLPLSNNKSTVAKTSKACKNAKKAPAVSKKSRALNKNNNLLSDEQSDSNINNPLVPTAEKSLLPNKRSASVKSPIPSKKPKIVSKKLTAAATKSKKKPEPQRIVEEESKKPCSPKELLFREDDNSSGVTDSDLNLSSLSSCLNSIKKKQPRSLGSATPPLRIFLPAGDNEFNDTNVDDELDSLSEYPVKPDIKYVVKRMAKANKPAATPNPVVNLHPSTQINTAPDCHNLLKIIKFKKTINSSQDDSDIEFSSFSDS